MLYNVVYGLAGSGSCLILSVNRIDACFNVETAHFFVIGDWGGLCNWQDNECKPGVSGDPGRNMPKGADNMPFAMPNRHGDYYVDLDPIP